MKVIKILATRRQTSSRILGSEGGRGRGEGRGEGEARER